MRAAGACRRGRLSGGTVDPADEDEYIRVVTAPFAEARQMIREKAIIDAKTALGIRMAGEYLGEEKRRGV